MRKPTYVTSAVMVLLFMAGVLSACRTSLQTLAGRDTGQVSVVTPEVATQEFVHPTWGMSFQYPADWSLDIPDFEVLSKPPPDMPPEGTFVPNELYERTLGHGVTLYPAQEGATPDTKIEISLDTFLISPGTPLGKWLNIRHAYGMVNSSAPDRTKYTQVDISDRPYTHVADQVAYATVRIDDPHLVMRTVWLAKGELVYAFTVYTDQETTVNTLEQVVSSVKFDDAKLAELRATAPFAGDESVMAAYVKSHPRPAPTATPQNNSQIAPGQTLAATRPSMNQKALPSSWSAPIIGFWPFTATVTCTSPEHEGQSEFAVDAIVPISTPVYAVIDGIVETSTENDPYGYGRLVLVRTTVSIYDQQRTYYHAYAHLNSRKVDIGQWVTKGTLVGFSGNSGNSTDFHLHFHIRDLDWHPVDATPVQGFRPNLNYPNVGTNCGAVVRSMDDPVVIDSAAFTQRFNRYGTNWDCINPYYSIAECYMRALPDNEIWFDPLDTNMAPELRYGVYLSQPNTVQTWYAWVCGDACNDGRDDSLHLGVNNSAPTTLRAVSVSNGWTWLSYQFPNGARPTFIAYAGPAIINVWVREDGVRFSRILLTTDAGYNPNGNVLCGPYPP